MEGLNKQSLTKVLCFWDNWEAHARDTKRLVVVLPGYAELWHAPCLIGEPWLQQHPCFIVFLFLGCAVCQWMGM